MEGTISTKELKAKLDRKENIKVVETLAPERYSQVHWNERFHPTELAKQAVEERAYLYAAWAFGGVTCLGNLTGT